MKKIITATRLIPQSFAHILLGLECYRGIYEDEKGIAEQMIANIKQAYREEYGEDLTHQSAQDILEKARDRGAGRKPVSPEVIERIRYLRSEGKSAQEIASICDVAARTVYKYS